MAAARLILALALTAVSAVQAAALPPPAYQLAAARAGIPASVLFAIALQESGTPLRGHLMPWPWTLNVAGTPQRFASRHEACAALRLARFNVNTAVVDKRYFQGLPSPAAAALVAGFIWLMTELAIPPQDVTWAMFAITLYTGLTMVTNVPFYSFKDLSLKKSVPFAAIVLVALAIAVINIHPPTVLFALFVVYGLSGYAIYFWRKAKGRPTSVISTSTDEPDERGLHD